MSLPFVKTSLTDVTKNLGTQFKVLFKNEYEQPCQSFKLRGIGNLIYRSIIDAENLNKTVVAFSSSGGNAGIAAAYGSNFYNIACTVVLPITSSPTVRETLKSLGATVIVHGKHWGEADAHVQTLISQVDESVYPIYVHPFDNPLIWDGHATIIDDLVNDVDDITKVKGIVCSCGGGGLYNGIYQGLTQNNLSIPILTVETKQAPKFSQALLQNKVVQVEVNTLVTTLGSPYLSQKSFDNYHNKDIKTYVKVIDDLDAIAGSVDFYDMFGTIVEPSCGATISYATRLLSDLPFGDLGPDDTVIFIVCGGSATDLEALNKYRSLVENH